jgi:hypothetical protein
MKKTTEEISQTAIRFHRNVMSCGEWSINVDNNAEARAIIMFDDVFVECNVKNLGCGVKKITGKRK